MYMDFLGTKSFSVVVVVTFKERLEQRAHKPFRQVVSGDAVGFLM